jgi:hypothetical protein
MLEKGGDRVITMLRSVGAMAVVVVVAYIGETGVDGGFIKDVWAAAKTASPFAAMFATLAWLKSDRERQRAQDQCQERTISFVESTNQHSAALEKMVEAVRTISGTIISATNKSKRRR